jgi:FkbM family methyltransferase
MIKFLRRKAIINYPVRTLLKKLAFQLTDKVKNYVVPRWRVSGEVIIEIDDVAIKMFSDCDDGIVDALYYNSSHYSEIEELSLFGNLARRSNFILDIGANTGFYSVFSAAKNPDAEIWAFEPYSSNIARLRYNLKLNNVKNVTLIDKAIGDEIKTIKISVPENNQICDTVSADAEFSNLFYKKFIAYKEVEVEQIKLDSLSYNRKIDLIKIDVENYELAVLEGARELLASMSPVIQCEIFVDESRIEFFEKVLKPLGYNCYMMLKNGVVFCDTLQSNLEGRDFLFTKRKLDRIYVSYKDKTLPNQLIP